ncbi:Putative mycofactocin biosynthesis glycosyltransferase MftF [Anaerolineae bacterium]|nr:Putative mycofactocin biosynthesis glycosyltransferase MftF [Anaerolineae bacterium]
MLMADHVNTGMVSVIIPAKNEGRRIARTLTAVLAQDFAGPYEVIVVDNGSTDGTGEEARRFPVTVLEEPRPGRAQARNAGIRSASGEILVFLDADCAPQSSWLRELLIPFSEPDVGCVAGEILPTDIETELHRYLSKIGYFSQKTTLSHPFRPFAQTGNAAYRKSVIDMIGLFDEGLLSGQDADLTWRMLLETDKRLEFAETAIVYHPYPKESRGFFKQRMRHAYGSVALFVKYRSYMPVKGKKETYWEYRALLKRALRTALAMVLNKNRDDVREQWFLVLAELSAKTGRVLGSIERRIWYL